MLGRVLCGVGIGRQCPVGGCVAGSLVVPKSLSGVVVIVTGCPPEACPETSIGAVSPPVVGGVTSRVVEWSVIEGSSSGREPLP